MCIITTNPVYKNAVLKIHSNIYPLGGGSMALIENSA